MTYPITAVTIPAHGDLTTVTIPSADAELEILQRLVGGYIEGVTLPADGLIGFVNEEGKILDLPANERATLGMHGRLLPGDFISGTLVVTGPYNEDGDPTSADEAAVREFLNRRVA